MQDEATLQSPLGFGDQSCNECRRRKAKCDRALPECGLCGRNKRHCLYERHSRTPLTRKYLTEVEARLRQTELRARCAERRAQAAELRLKQYEEQHATGSNDNAPGLLPEPLLAEYDCHETTAEQPLGQVSPTWQVIDQSLGRTFDQVAHQNQSPTTPWLDGRTVPATEDDVPIKLESAPEWDDFSWDEQSVDSTADFAQSEPSKASADEDRVVDGMASLNVEEGEGGYLGVASGAAMLRLLLPDAEHGKQRKNNAFSRQRSNSRRQPRPSTNGRGTVPTPLWDVLNISALDLDSAIDAYFGLYHLSYPIIHEPTFRAQYAQVIPRPAETSWNALAYMIAAIGSFTAATTPTTVDRVYFMAAKSNMSIASLETGNLPLVQALTLMSNYLQKRNKPNSGYNYLGLALHMAMGLGLHKEFHDWDISPLNMEIRRRVWWCICVFNVGATITFGRPLAWPSSGIDVSLPLNIHDRDLTTFSASSPLDQANSITTYSSVIMQSNLHLVTNNIYTRAISTQIPSARALVMLDDDASGKWMASIPAWYREDADVPPKFFLSHSINWWRMRNFKIIMYRPYVIRLALQSRGGSEAEPSPSDARIAYDRCLAAAKESIASISSFWDAQNHTLMAAWYTLYFLFQASLIPCVCLRNGPTLPQAADWRNQIQTTLQTISKMKIINPKAQECYDVVEKLCGQFIQNAGASSTPIAGIDYPTEESPQTQISNVYAMMWPSVNAPEVDMMMQDGIWSDFLGEELSQSVHAQPDAAE